MRSAWLGIELPISRTRLGSSSGEKKNRAESTTRAFARDTNFAERRWRRKGAESQRFRNPGGRA